VETEEAVFLPLLQEPQLLVAGVGVAMVMEVVVLLERAVEV